MSDAGASRLFGFVVRVKQQLIAVLYWRALLMSVGALLAMMLVRLAFHRPSTTRTAVLLLAVFCFIIAAISRAGRHARSVTPIRSALWIEEQEAVTATPRHAPTAPSFALVTFIEEALRHGDESSSHNALLTARATETLQRIDIDSALEQVTTRRLRGPLVFIAGAAVVLVVAHLVPFAQMSRTVASRAAAPGDAPAGTAIAPLGAWRISVDPPAYSRIPSRSLGDVSIVTVLSGTVVRLRGDGPVPSDVELRTIAADSAVPRVVVAQPDGNGWQLRLVADERSSEVRIARGGRTRLLLLESHADSLPVVVLERPSRDSVLRTASGRYPLVASVHDDLGLREARFELIISSGEGERFTAKTVTVGARRYAGTTRTDVRATLNLAEMQLRPGDIVHLRAVARDAHPRGSRELGTSETRTFRIARPADYDSVAVEPAPPPEVDKSLLSQRMLLRLAEKLEQRRSRMARPAVLSESQRLARDQARLRQSVGDVVFQRLSGESSAEHSHFAGDGHEHGVALTGGKLALSAGGVRGMIEEGNDSPVIAINQPLLEAYNAMWDAGRELEQGEPRAAIPHMRLALAAIERARAATRVYLRGKPPTVIVDVAKVRMAGKDTGQTNQRRSREALTRRNAERDARVVRAAQLLKTNVEAARDSLALLRLESVGDAPGFAAALDVVLQHLAGTEAPSETATEALIRARRALSGMSRGPLTSWSRPGPP